jgi:ketosteroid isomerase-like protein
VVADLAPDFEYVASGAVPGAGGVFRGTDGLRRFMEAFWGEFDDTRIEVHEFIDAGDQVVVSSTLQGRGKQSGAEATWNNVPQVWNLRDGKVVHGQGFMSRHDALEAAGLSE